MRLIESHLAADDAELAAKWKRLETWISGRFGRDVSIEAVLFLIGVQSRGRGYEPDLPKAEKQDTIMEGTYCAFEKLGLYERVGLDERGYWIWERSDGGNTDLDIDQQEKLLKLGIVRYFDDEFAADISSAHVEDSQPPRSRHPRN